MRYSMLVHLSKMSRTLLEAADYLDSAAADGGLRAELLENGRQMLGQIRTELERHKKDLHSSQLLDLLTAAETLWEADGSKRMETLAAFADLLPNSVNFQIRAVFFASLGEIWDSMESVYQFMRDDPRFDPVVVLIPVVRQAERHGETIQDVIYQDYLTPVGVPFLGYTDYSLEEDCPDLAFINQPYEGTVPADFWPRTIAQYSRLVYLPYYLPDLVEFKTKEFLCDEPVYHQAWKTICSNEKAYRYYCKNTAYGGINGLLTGLPKLDHLVSLKERGVPLPSGWEGLKQQKVFLWNTWYVYGASSINWFDKILAWFEAHENCTLIWRPHPMTETGIKMYYPKAYPVYQQALARVEAMQNVILDQETSYEAAFYYSHALFSDYSSMLPQYLLMDKPALWIRKDGWGFTGEEFIESRWMEQAKTVDEALDFLNRISAGEDRNASLRQIVREQDLPLADGHSGERVCESLLEAMCNEDFAVQLPL